MPNTKITIPRPMTREKKGNLPRSGVTAVSPALNQRERKNTLTDLPRPPSSSFPLLKHHIFLFPFLFFKGFGPSLFSF